jgi:hypothetical protein
MLAGAYLMYYDPIRMLYCFQGVTFMPRLPTAFLAVAFP